ncbi:hypothetical protein OG558_00285 [Kribbella sp. NBC_01510]|uniref:hypothetical protein n=1 Tax=Kribbella sp. NBC_01510 TaxID=2903581 RepID=UPI00386CFD15
MLKVESDRGMEVFRLYQPMIGAMDDVLAGYSGAGLDLIAGFLRRSSEAGERANDQLAQE